jgi:hypothetical protein
LCLLIQAQVLDNVSMKKNQKGFIVPLLIVLVALIIIGAVVLHFHMRASESKQSQAAAAALSQSPATPADLLVFLPGVGNETDGVFGQYGRMTDLENYLSQNVQNFGTDFDVGYVPYGSLTQGVDQDVADLDTFLEGLPNLASYQHIYIVNHSLGYIVLRNAVLNANGWGCAAGTGAAQRIGVNSLLQTAFKKAIMLNISPLPGSGDSPIVPVIGQLLLPSDSQPQSAYSQCVFSKSFDELFNNSINTSYDYTYSSVASVGATTGTPKNPGKPVLVYGDGDPALDGVWDYMSVNKGYRCNVYGTNTLGPVQKLSPPLFYTLNKAKDAIWYKDYENAKAPHHISYYDSCVLPGEGTTPLNASLVNNFGPVTFLGNAHFVLLEYTPVWQSIAQIITPNLIRVQVNNSVTGAPISGATVSVARPVGGPTVTQTDSTGRTDSSSYTLNTTHVITVSASGYTTVSKGIDVTHAINPITIALKPTTTPPAATAIYSPGTDNSGNILPTGSIDPHWKINGATAYVYDLGTSDDLEPGIYPFPAYDTPMSGSSYTYSTTFTIPTAASLSGASLEVSYDMVPFNGFFPSVYLNGALIPTPALYSVNITSGFVQGVNTLSFVYQNHNGYGVPLTDEDFVEAIFSSTLPFVTYKTPSVIPTSEIAPVLTLLTPAKGTTVKEGVATKITWSSSDIAASQLIRIALYHSATSYTIIATVPNSGSYSWTPSTSIAAGTYAFDISEADNSSVSGSTGTFTISQ